MLTSFCNVSRFFWCLFSSHDCWFSSISLILSTTLWGSDIPLHTSHIYMFAFAGTLFWKLWILMWVSEFLASLHNQEIENILGQAFLISTTGRSGVVVAPLVKACPQSLCYSPHHSLSPFTHHILCLRSIWLWGFSGLEKIDSDSTTEKWQTVVIFFFLIFNALSIKSYLLGLLSF